MNEFGPVASKVFGVFLVIFAGAVTRRLGWLNKEADRTLASLTANLLLPAFYFERIVHSEHLTQLQQAWLPPLLGFASTAAGFGLAALAVYALASLLRFENSAQSRAFILCVGICNYGYIPLPLAEHFYPNSIVSLMIHNVGVDLALWSIGILILSGDLQANWRRALVSPPLIAVTLALAVRGMGLADAMPESFNLLVHSLGQCAIPLGLMLSGAIIVDYAKQANLSLSVRVMTASVVLRLLMIPVAIFALAFYIPMQTELQQVLLLQAAMPSATFPVVLCRLYGQDTATAVRVVLATSFGCLVTMPLWLIFGAKWLGLS
jgi:malate permease and related proteins